MSSELNLRFPDEARVEVTYDGEPSGMLPFASPLTDQDRRDLAWYLEIYGAHSLGDPDDIEAARLAARLPELGKALFDAVFQGPALRLFQRFQDRQDSTRLLTVSAEHPEILALPWELLHDSARGGVYLFLETPRISIRRRLAGATGGRPPFRVEPKERLHLLFVVSRPEGAGFLDPRADPKAVLDAVEEHAPGRVTWEFLRPATLDALVERLEDREKPPVDVLHFDGHGVFDRRGGLPEAFARERHRRFSRAEEILRAPAVGAASAPNTGYLLFETAEGEVDFVAAQRLGENLHRHKVALVILSACQSAALGEGTEGDEGDPAERAMGSVAARLTAAGLPAVLAMTHTVLVPTTRALFGELYEELARHRGVGEALDNGRRYLYNNPEKYEVQRGPERVWLSLQDWFVPALYQSGPDLPLLRRLEPSAAMSAPLASTAVRTNLPPEPEAGFYGRRWELWQIERWFAGSTRRITLTGFGGQGKTALAQEAGRWLLRTGMFQAAAFVDYSRIQAADALAVAVSQIGSVLGVSLPDAEAARHALASTPTLVILDNLEALAEEPLRELLDAAVGWSAAGDSRVLLTTRRPDFGHAGYRVEGTRVHRRIQLSGLGSREAPDDALGWFGELMKLPPAPSVPTSRREELIDLFAKVKFHPLSIRVLAEQAKLRRLAEMGERLEGLLAQPAGVDTSDETLPELVASLQLSLDRLDPAARALLPRLGVFQGGGWEPMILGITEIPEADWGGLRRQLEAAALMEAEDLSGWTVPFLRFHPTLTTMLWAQVVPEQQARLGRAHRQEYYGLANYLYNEDRRTPHEARAIASRELPNLLHAVHAALAEGDPDAVDFANSVTWFLSHFGLRREIASLVAGSQAAAGETGSSSWFLVQSNRGEQLLAAGRVQEAAGVFREMLSRLGETPRYERALTLGHLGRCFQAGGRPDLAERGCRDALAVLDQLGPSDDVRLHRGILLTDLADVLSDQGRYAEAREAYKEGREIAQELGDLRGQGVSLMELGTLALQEGNLEEAVKQYRGALALFQQLQEPASEAMVWYQLGRTSGEARQWDEAERHYRESARIEERLGDLAGATRTWNEVANVNQLAGKPAAAETWYRKTIEGGRQTGDVLPTMRALSNLAVLLRSQPGRLAEARQLAEEALGIMKTLDPGVSEIWKTYSMLAGIADQEGQPTQAREHRRLAREAKRNFAGTRHELRRVASLIRATVIATQELGQREALEKNLPAPEQRGYTNLVAAIRRILAGERDADALCESLNLDESMIVEAILGGIEDPSSLQDLLPAAPGS
ncbi:MAG TPA: tetratricopeptide repeat protein [Thermoanaerobaculia bacterium]|jgi:tetratricopeptide (TPR) repeat protein